MSDNIHTKLVVAIRSPTDKKDRRDAIRETWGKDFSDLGANVFFILSGDPQIISPTLKEDVLYTPGFNTHRDLTNRMCWLWKYLSGLSYSHVLVMDDDCSVNVPVFMSLDWGKSDAWGHDNGGFLSGSAAVYSKRAVEKLNYSMPKDDVVIGAVLSHLKIKLTHAGYPCPVKPWPSTNKKWTFGDANVAIAHYVRTPEKIKENHSKLLRRDENKPKKTPRDVINSELLKNVVFVQDRSLISHTARLSVDKDRKYVKKELIKHRSHDCIKREAFILKTLNAKGYDWALQLVHSEDEMMITKYAGDPIDKKNIPIDYRRQARAILRDLKENDIRHNDIKKSEILVQDGKIRLCDFGWASINDDFSCGINISNKKKMDGIYSDQRLIKILDSIASARWTPAGRAGLVPKVTYNLPLDRKEKHIIIDWTNFFLEKQMINTIEQFGLEVNNVIHMNKLDDKIETISKLYDTPVNDFRGAQDFTVYIVSDSECTYDYRATGKGNRRVNIKPFDLKRFLRKKTGGYKIHATDNVQETRDNLRALGLYESNYSRKSFKNISEVFDELNKLNHFKYVVMRNFEDMPNNIKIDEHLDVDLLVSDYYTAKAILDADSVLKAGYAIKPNQRYENGGCRILNNVLIDGKEVWFDLRYLGDDYYDINLEKQILNNRIKRHNFYVPDDETHFYSVMYHALIHKHKISKTYQKIFMKNKIDQENVNNKDYLFEALKTYMDAHEFKCVRPKDNSVGFTSDNPLTKK